MANHTFGGVQFRTEQQDGTSVPIIPPGDAVLATEHIAGGDLDVTQDLGGRGTAEVTYPLVVEQANWAAFFALYRQSATLAMIGNTSRTAKLTKLTGIKWFEAEGKYKVVATWVVG